MADQDLVVLMTELDRKLVSPTARFEKPKKQDLVAAEIKGLARHLNSELAQDSLLQIYLPIVVDDTDLLHKVSDGVLHCAFIRSISPESIPITKIMTREVKGRALNMFEMQANQRLYIDAVVNLGLVVVNIGENDLIDAVHHVNLVLGLLWQLLDRQLRLRTGLIRSPRLLRHQSLDEHKQLVLDWFNRRLSSTDVIITNFSTDLLDGRAYLLLLRLICPASMPVPKPHQLNSDLSRAQAVISATYKMALSPLLDEHDIVLGHEQLNLAFIQSLIGWCRSREQQQQDGSEMGVLEVQAPIMAQQLLNADSRRMKKVAHEEDLLDHALLLFYLGMRSWYITRLKHHWQHLVATPLSRVMMISITAPTISSLWRIRPQTKTETASIAYPAGSVLRWTLTQFRIHTWTENWDRDGGTVPRPMSALERPHPYWTPSLLPAFESMGLLLTRRHPDRESRNPDLIAPLLATAIGRTVVAPFETIQIRHQIGGATVRYTNLFHGHQASLARLLPYSYIQFLACNQDALAHGRHDGLILATGVATVVTYPLDLAQTQMASMTKRGGITRHLWSSAQRHGLVPGLYRGVLPHSLGATAFMSTHLLSNAHLSDVFDPELGGLLSFMTSLIATYPARTISRRMQAELLLMPQQYLPTMSQVANRIAQSEGIHSFYKGIGTALLKTVPAYVMTAAAYHHIVHRRD